MSADTGRAGRDGGIFVMTGADCCMGEAGAAGDDDRGGGSGISGEESDSMLCSRC